MFKFIMIIILWLILRHIFHNIREHFSEHLSDPVTFEGYKEELDLDDELDSDEALFLIDNFIHKL